MADLPVIVVLLALAGVAALGVFGARGLKDIVDALHAAEFDRLAALSGWPAARGLSGVLAGIPTGVVVNVVSGRSDAALVAGLSIAGIICVAAPQLLSAVRRRVERRVLDELALHLDLLAVAMEAGGSFTTALAACIERSPDGPLRRAWQRVVLDIHGGQPPLDALRTLDQQLKLPAFSTLVSALRAAEKLQRPFGAVLRDRARQAAASRFARAEREARAAPLRLWAAMWLCLLPCTAVVLAFPAAWLLAKVMS